MAESLTEVKTNSTSSGSYRSILKGTSIFGGVQIMNIILTLIRGKFVAIILGPEGMGISSLFNSASNTIQRLSSFGLGQAIVRETAATDKEVDKSRLISITLRLIRITGVIGAILCMALCIPLSRLTFGDYSYYWQFILLGLAVGFGVESAGKLAILQGLHQVKRISRASVIGGLIGLFIGVPLYYIFGDKGIVPAMIAVSFSLYIFYSLSLNKCTPERFVSFNFSWKENKETIRRLILLGLVLMAGDIIGTAIGYAINLFVRIFGSVDDVGLYQAANSVTNQYAGLVFSAMAMDYFPRLSKVATENTQMNLTVNRQTEIVAALMTPAMCLLILSTPLLIRVLLAESFHSIIPLMRWMGLGIMLRAFSFPMAYITFAKGNKKVFFLMEGLTANVMTLALSCIFFYYFGLMGLGYALVADNGLCILLYFVVNNRLYGYNFSREAGLYLFIGAILVIGVFLFSFSENVAISYTFMSVITLVSLFWCFLSLKKKLKSDVTSGSNP